MSQPPGWGHCRAYGYVVVAVLAFLLISFIFRSPVASWYVHRKASQYGASHHVALTIGRVKIHGLASILVTGISLKPAAGDTLLKIDTAFASIGILKLLAGRLALHDVMLVNTKIRLERGDSTANYNFLLRQKRPDSDTVSGDMSYAATADRLMRFIFDKIPLSLRLRNFSVEYRTPNHSLAVGMTDFSLVSHFFRSQVLVTEDSARAAWTIAGRVDNGNRLAEFRMYASDTGKIRLPWLQRKWNALVEFDTLAFSIGEQEGGSDLAKINGFATLKGMRIDHRRIASGPVLFDNMGIRYLLNIGRDYAELDSATVVTFNRVDLNPYIRYRSHPTKQFTVRVHKPPFPAQDLFSSFPEGLFTNLDGIRVKGNLAWHLDFFVDLAIPDSLEFETSLDRQGFSVISYGNADIFRINGPFQYTAYEHDLPVRSFMVGPENPEFRPLERISPYLRYAVLTCEDGGFFQHRGFLPDAFRESIVTNIKERRFARGGSTISMQLVKNVFLSRNKTVARKLEEALLVWLIENQAVTTKERMFEVYLNIIEWGPMIYGAGEASRFYFSKDVSKLTLAEAIFMASVIPRPKWFMYNFDPGGHLKPSNADFYRLVSGKMVHKGWISEEEAVRLIPDVELRGAAKLLLKRADTVRVDSGAYPVEDL